jgi:chromosome segregation ATPase
LIALNAEISALKQMISRELDNDKDDGIGESSMSSTEEQQPNVSEITLEISRLHQFILKWKSSNDAKVYKAEHEIERLLEENNRLSQDSNAQLTQLAEKHQNLSDLASKEATLQIIDLQNKLRNAETTIGEHKTKLNSLNKELERVSEHYENSQRTIKDLKKDLSDTQESTDKLENEICLLKEKYETQKTECGKLKEENNNIKSELLSSQHNEALLRNKLEESESKLHIKTLEKDKIQEAFENVNGLVFGSFEDFESYYKSQLLDKEKGLEIKDSENKTLQQRLVQLTCDNEKLKCELQNALDKTPQDEHEEKTEQSQTQEMDKITSELDMLLDTIEKANVNVSKWLHHSTDGEESSDMTSAEDKCKKLTNNLNELDIHFKTDKETLANIVEEKDKFESQCKSSALEMER